MQDRGRSAKIRACLALGKSDTETAKFLGISIKVVSRIRRYDQGNTMRPGVERGRVRKVMQIALTENAHAKLYAQARTYNITGASWMRMLLEIIAEEPTLAANLVDDELSAQLEGVNVAKSSIGAAGKNGQRV